jgi:hypothetical protein
VGLDRLAEAVPYLKGRVSYPDDLDSDGPSLTTRLVVRWSPTDADLHFREHPMASKLPELEAMKRERAPARAFPDGYHLAASLRVCIIASPSEQYLMQRTSLSKAVS